MPPCYKRMRHYAKKRGISAAAKSAAVSSRRVCDEIGYCGDLFGVDLDISTSQI